MEEIMKTFFSLTATVLLSITLLCATLPRQGRAADKSKPVPLNGVRMLAKQKVSAKEMLEIKKKTDMAVEAVTLRFEEAKTEEEKSLAKELLEYAKFNAKNAAVLLKTAQKNGSVDWINARLCSAVTMTIHRTNKAIAAGDANAGKMLDRIAAQTDKLAARKISLQTRLVTKKVANVREVKPYFPTVRVLKAYQKDVLTAEQKKAEKTQAVIDNAKVDKTSSSNFGPFPTATSSKVETKKKTATAVKAATTQVNKQVQAEKERSLVENTAERQQNQIFNRNFTAYQTSPFINSNFFVTATPSQLKTKKKMAAAVETATPWVNKQAQIEKEKTEKSLAEYRAEQLKKALLKEKRSLAKQKSTAKKTGEIKKKMATAVEAEIPWVNKAKVKKERSLTTALKPETPWSNKQAQREKEKSLAEYRAEQLKKALLKEKRSLAKQKSTAKKTWETKKKMATAVEAEIPWVNNSLKEKGGLAKQRISAKEMWEIKKKTATAVEAAKLGIKQAKTEKEKSLAEELLEDAKYNDKLAAGLLKTAKIKGSVDRKAAQKCEDIAATVHETAQAIAAGDDPNAEKLLDKVAAKTGGLDEVKTAVMMDELTEIRGSFKEMLKKQESAEAARQAAEMKKVFQAKKSKSSKMAIIGKYFKGLGKKAGNATKTGLKTGLGKAKNATKTGLTKTGQAVKEFGKFLKNSKISIGKIGPGGPIGITVTHHQK
ncbi:MAG: hypothetical protein D3919_02770 [Candidatus Electrothrix sp. AW5]|nr:hypothetical protein [Candidatus Electrothrix gigas]